MLSSKTIKYLDRYTFFIAFPGLLFFGQNFSILFFLLFWFSLQNRNQYLKINFGIQKIIILFVFGAIVSTFNTNIELAGLGLSSALAVLPNYIYWSFLLIILINFRRYINHLQLSKHLFWGLCISVFYVFISPSLPKIPGVINPLYSNNIAFLSICFTAPSIVYLYTLNKKKYAYLFLIIVLLILLILERRAGFVLVFLTSIASLFLYSMRIKTLVAATFAGIFFYVLINTSFVEASIYNISPRIHESIYSSENITTEDRSYLLRRLMVEKTLIIFEEHPLTGIGLNNFTNYDVYFAGNFEGSQFVVNKDGTNEKSAHNSYASILAEGGLLLFIPFALLLLFNIKHFFKSFTKRTQIENAFYWSFLGMCIHLYFISAILNVFAWFLIGVVTALSVKSKRGELGWSRNLNFVKA